MYGRKEASLIRTKFWTSFGLYMKPVHGANEEKINWLNYKTGIIDIYFRMNADTKSASIALEIRKADESERKRFYEQLLGFKHILDDLSSTGWTREEQYRDESDNIIPRVYQEMDGVNIFQESDWPAVISFLKPRIIALDAFWFQVKDVLE